MDLKTAKKRLEKIINGKNGDARDILSELAPMNDIGDHATANVGKEVAVACLTIRKLERSRAASDAAITLGTITVPDFRGDNALFWHYGRIKRNAYGNIVAIVELRDATEEERAIREVNITNYCFKTKWLWDNIGAITDKNSAQEFYLTDMVNIAALQGVPICSYPIQDIREGIGFNTVEQAEFVERQLK